MPRNDTSEVPVTLQIGKFGITDSVLAEMDSQLERNGEIKVRMLRSAPEVKKVKEAMARVAERLDAQLASSRGHTALFKRKQGRRVFPSEKV
jgi:RNA-binding protein YhbY